jgi:cardiolipin synthase
MYKNIPNILTMLRIIIIPIIIITFYFEDKVFAYQLACGLFILAGITDFLDGYLARKYKLQSKFGIMFDPIADKLLVGSVLIMLVKFNRAEEVPCLLIMAREFAVAGLREFLAQVRISVPVSNIAKVKTFMQIIALSILLLGSKGSGIEAMDSFGEIFLWITAALTIFTGYSYLKASRKYW